MESNQKFIDCGNLSRYLPFINFLISKKSVYEEKYKILRKCIVDRKMLEESAVNKIQRFFEISYKENSRNKDFPDSLHKLFTVDLCSDDDDVFIVSTSPNEKNIEGVLVDVDIEASEDEDTEIMNINRAINCENTKNTSQKEVLSPNENIFKQINSMSFVAKPSDDSTSQSFSPFNNPSPPLLQDTATPMLLQTTPPLSFSRNLSSSRRSKMNMNGAAEIFSETRKHKKDQKSKHKRKKATSLKRLDKFLKHLSRIPKLDIAEDLDLSQMKQNLTENILLINNKIDPKMMQNKSVSQLLEIQRILVTEMNSGRIARGQTESQKESESSDSNLTETRNQKEGVSNTQKCCTVRNENFTRQSDTEFSTTNTTPAAHILLSFSLNKSQNRLPTYTSAPQTAHFPMRQTKADQNELWPKQSTFTHTPVLMSTTTECVQQQPHLQIINPRSLASNVEVFQKNLNISNIKDPRVRKLISQGQYGYNRSSVTLSNFQNHQKRAAPDSESFKCTKSQLTYGEYRRRQQEKARKLNNEANLSGKQNNQLKHLSSVHQLKELECTINGWKTTQSFVQKNNELKKRSNISVPKATAQQLSVNTTHRDQSSSPVLLKEKQLQIFSSPLVKGVNKIISLKPCRVLLKDFRKHTILTQSRINCNANRNTKPPKKTVEKTKKTLKIRNTSTRMTQRNTKQCVLCKRRSKDLPHHYIQDHKSESFVSRLTWEELEDWEQKVPFVEEVPLKTNKRGSSIYKAECPFCPIEKARLTDCFSNLRKHFSMHTGEFSYQCKRCGLKRAFTSEIKKHQDRTQCKGCVIKCLYKYHANQRVIYMYVCQICNYVQLNEENVYKHLREQHGNLTREPHFVKEYTLAAIKDGPIERIPLNTLPHDIRIEEANETLDQNVPEEIENVCITNEPLLEDGYVDSFQSKDTEFFVDVLQEQQENENENLIFKEESINDETENFSVFDLKPETLSAAGDNLLYGGSNDGNSHAEKLLAEPIQNKPIPKYKLSEDLYEFPIRQCTNLFSSSNVNHKWKEQVVVKRGNGLVDYEDSDSDATILQDE